MRKVLVLAAVLAGFAPAHAADPLGIGDPAPALAVKGFVKGEPVKGFDKGGVYVVEFWATWCGPCIATIPHVTELQKKFPKATMIGVSVWERGKDVDEKVKAFVEKMGDKMDYRVAQDVTDDDGKNGKMATGWMEAAEQNGIPTAFIVNGDGKIAWVGHPAEMDKPLEKIVAGDWDLAAARAEAKKAAARNAKMRALSAKVRKAQKDPKALIGVLDEAIADDPGMEVSLGGMKLNTLIKLNDMDKALAYGDRLVGEVLKDSAMGLNNIAWPLVEKPGKEPNPKLMKLAVRMAERADELLKGKDGAVADTLGKAYFEAGELAKAVTAQERAVKLAGDSADAADIKERLAQFKKALAEKTDK